MSFRPLTFGVLLALPVLGFGANTLSTDSPFTPAGGATGPAAAPDNTEYEFVGALTAGDETMVGILNKSTQKNFWVGVGKSVEGFELISRNAQTGEVVARYAGATHTLKLREPSAAKSTVVAYTPPPVPNPGNRPVPTAGKPVKPAGPNQAPAAAPPDQERDARMLVSDLLEIGAQQRKAYEEAQKRKGATPPATK